MKTSLNSIDEDSGARFANNESVEPTKSIVTGKKPKIFPQKSSSSSLGSILEFLMFSMDACVIELTFEAL